MSSHRKPKTINPDEVDPSVYYYDEVYDDLQDQKADAAANTDKKPKKQQGSKYIQGIIETAERRKSEKEIRKFKRFARDREEAQESGDIASTDVYVTKSYERKLREMQGAIEKSSKIEDEGTLNSFKRPRHQNVKERDADCEKDANPSKDKDNFDHPHDGSETNDKPHCQDECAAANTSQEKTPVRRPKTLEERRDYLRVVLSKRTVGDHFKAAKERYWQRKSKLDG